MIPTLYSPILGKIISLYDLSFIDNNGNEVKMDQFQGKKLLIVNTASLCGSTPQYEELQRISKDVTVLAFPCNQFGNQEPGTDEEIKEFCTTKYGVTFTVSKKIDVNGPHAHPIYRFCRESAVGGKNIGWNFEKFLISEDGSIKHYNNSHPIEDIIK